MTRARGPNYASPHNFAAQRAAHRKKLAWDWIMNHRPDVAEAIYKEAEKKFPLVPDRRIQVNDLPESLRKLK